MKKKKGGAGYALAFYYAGPITEWILPACVCVRVRVQRVRATPGIPRAEPLSSKLLQY